MFFFESREKARNWAKMVGKKFVDNGATAQKRWAVKVV